jgi:hypothetical protein
VHGEPGAGVAVEEAANERFNSNLLAPDRGRSRKPPRHSHALTSF